MFIKSIDIKNFRIFNTDIGLEIQDFNIPNGKEGSGINLFVWENGCWKTSLLESLAFPVLSYKSDNFSIDDMHDPKSETTIQVFAKDPFDFKGTMPKWSYKGQGFLFKAHIRDRSNKSYLSSIITKDQQYIKATGEDKPKDNSPDLRFWVDNPFSGARFTENDFLFLDKNRITQTRSWVYNSTRFDRLMEDFNFQYISKSDSIEDLNHFFSEKCTGISNDFFKKSIEKFSEVSNHSLVLSLIDSWKPFVNAKFWVKKDNNQIVWLNNIWSWYEMIFSLIYTYFLSQQSWKELIIFIDELELHLHPKIQKKFIEFLLDISKNSQIFITTHSPLLVKEFLRSENVMTYWFKNEGNDVSQIDIDSFKLDYLSANEINYVVFWLITEEYHNELYEHLKKNNGEELNIYDFDKNYFQDIKGELPGYPYNWNANRVSLHTRIRTQIHHRWEEWLPDYDNIEKSLSILRDYT